MENSKRILIVDDDPSVRMVLRKRLEDRSFRIFEAQEGSSGLALAKKNRPDLILLDIVMPGEDGIQTYRALKADPDTQAIPIVFLSALAEGMNQVQQDGMGGPYVVLGKPYSPDELLRKVQQALGETAGRTP